MSKRLHDLTQGLQFRILTPLFLLMSFVTILFFYGYWWQYQEARSQVEADLSHFVQGLAHNQEVSFTTTQNLLITLSQVADIRSDNCNSFLNQVHQQYFYHSAFGIADLEGNVTCFSQPLSKPLNVKDRYYFQEALKTKRFVVGDYIIGRPMGTPTLSFSYPILNAQGEVEKVLFTGLTLNWLNESLQDIPLMPGSVLSLLDNKGNLLARQPSNEQAIGKPAESYLLDSLRDQESAVFAYRTEDSNAKEERYLVAFTGLDTTRTQFVLYLPENLAFSKTRKVFLEMSLSLLVFCGLVLISIYLVLNRWVIQPTTTLIESILEIRQGKITVHPQLISLKRKGELGHLTQEFKAMTEFLLERKLAVDLAEAELKASNLRLQEESLRDPLTKLFNRRYLEESLSREIAKSHRSGRNLAVVMIDVDYFKRFNDQFGHIAGDSVLIEIAKLLQNNVRAEDIACRFGGEEFTLVLTDISQEAVLKRLEEIRYCASKLNIAYQGQSLGKITLSLGLACLKRSEGSLESVINLADKALYRAKEQGRNQLVIAS